MLRGGVVDRGELGEVDSEAERDGAVAVDVTVAVEEDEDEDEEDVEDVEDVAVDAAEATLKRCRGRSALEPVGVSGDSVSMPWLASAAVAVSVAVSVTVAGTVSTMEAFLFHEKPGKDGSRNVA